MNKSKFVSLLLLWTFVVFIECHEQTTPSSSPVTNTFIHIPTISPTATQKLKTSFPSKGTKSDDDDDDDDDDDGDDEVNVNKIKETKVPSYSPTFSLPHSTPTAEKPHKTSNPTTNKKKTDKPTTYPTFSVLTSDPTSSPIDSFIGVLLTDDDVKLEGFLDDTTSVSTNLLFDLKLDSSEETNLFDDSSMSEVQIDLLERRLSWMSKLVDATLPDDTGKVEAWDKAGGVVPWLKTDFDPIKVDRLFRSDSAPHIVFVLVDDWGYNDVGFRSTYMNWTTPNIDRLADEGLKLSNHYSHFSCTPTRGALLTGRYATRLGLWDYKNIIDSELPLNETTLAQELQSAGYKTYMVGKWHLGTSTKQHLPTRRGFDKFYGFIQGQIDYRTKEDGGYLDLHDGEDLVTDSAELSTDMHNAYLFQQKAEEMIISHATKLSNKPMFLYYSLQLVHSPWDAPEEFLQRCSYPSNVDDVDLRADYYNYCGMNVMLDEVIANLTCTLETYNMSDSTILMIVSDNGGANSLPGSNYPYRGFKGTNFRGGVSTTAIIHGKLVSEEMRGQTYHGQVHITDWLPTLMGLATDDEWEGSLTGAEIDGVNVWHSLMIDDDSPHEEILHYHDGKTCSIQYNMYKLDYEANEIGAYIPEAFFTKDILPDSAYYSCENPSLMYDTGHYDDKDGLGDGVPVAVSRTKSEVVGAGIAALLGIGAIILSSTMFYFQIIKRKDECDDEDDIQLRSNNHDEIDDDTSLLIKNESMMTTNDALLPIFDYGSIPVDLDDV